MSDATETQDSFWDDESIEDPMEYANLAADADAVAYGEF